MTTADAAKAADIVMILVSDHIQADLYNEHIEPNLKQGAALMFAHGFNVHFGFIKPRKDLDVLLVAPKAPGHRVRELFEEGMGVPGLVAIFQDASGNAMNIGLAYAKGIGCLKAGVIQTSFKEETETDLFGEQAVLCGGASALVKAGFDTLVEAGYQPEIAYFECLHELKLIVDLMYRGGLNYMRYSVSDTAERGDYVAGDQVIGPESKAAMKKLLKNVQDGTFAKEWFAENEAGRPEFNKRRRSEQDHPIEQVGAKLREMMTFVDPVTIKPGD
jgi:ketol-acid reductoisomerase